jgi:hypothetical protein
VDRDDVSEMWHADTPEHEMSWVNPRPQQIIDYYEQRLAAVRQSRRRAVWAWRRRYDRVEHSNIDPLIETLRKALQ